MPRYVAFLRGMNVGGHRIKSDELRRLFEGMGLQDVATFRTAGNVIFSTGDEDLRDVTLRIQTDLAKALGYEVPVFVRTAEQMRAIAAFEPFEANLIEASAGKLQVALLTEKPTKQVQAQALALSSEQDRLLINGSELYWLPSGGILDSPLDLKAIGKTLGLSTTRTKGTIDLIASKFFA